MKKYIKHDKLSSTENYTYDLSDRLVSREVVNGLKSQYSYDNNSNISQITTTFTGTNKTTKYWYDRDNRINHINLGNSNSIWISYDSLSRTADRTLMSGSNTYKTAYTYKDTQITKRTTTILETMQNGTKPVISYTYDELGNIETITEGNTLKQKYYYDELSQLIREDNKDKNKTITYEYDAGGNILSKTEYAYTTGSTLQNPTSVVEYGYTNTNWKDQLTSYAGKTITYDTIGNPLTYDGNTYTWENGRQLKRIQNTSKSQDITYKYNDSGIRTEKTVNGTTTKYYLDGTKVIYEQTGSNLTRYMYDETDQVVGMDYNGSIYFFVKNGQGDIIGILNNNLAEVANYTYDSWGNIISIKDASGNEITSSSHIANINPYRYRGYRYDTETGMYYLQNRYYNPEWGRMLNADTVLTSYGTLQNTNMYAYCNNNPINMQDEEGELPFLIPIVFGLIVLRDIYIAITNPTEENIGTAVLGVMPGGKVAGTAAKVTKAVTKSVAKTTTKKTAHQLGKEGEEAVSKLLQEPKNTKKIDVQNKQRIPDFYVDKKKYMAEVKNTKTQSFTKQLRDYQIYAQENNYKFELFIRPGADTSAPLRDSGITIRYIPRG